MMQQMTALVLCLSCITSRIGSGAVHAADALVAQPVRQLNLPQVLPAYTAQQRPAYMASTGLASFDTTPDDNPLTDAGAFLGRVLFYDTRLSANSTVSCSTCHVQKHAFSDPRPVSTGFRGRPMDRNSLALHDLRYTRAGFFWDERSESLEEAVLQPLFSHVEMGLDPATLIDRLSHDSHYTGLFEKAFPSREITVSRVARALAQFIRSMESNRSKYDEAVANVPSSRDNFPAFTSSENLGKRVFFDRCVSCHHLGNEPKVAIFAMFRSLNNGIDRDGTVRDGGRGDVTFDPSEVGSFKASTLRNVEYTAPYMHDGRLATLEDVIEHYSTGVNRHPNLGPVVRHLFSAEEKTALVDFLKTLSDPHFITDPKFSDPWEPPAQASQQPGGNALRHSGVAVHLQANDLLRWLEQGQGLPANSTHAWLLQLDQDGNGALSENEVQPVIALLQKIGGITPRSRTRSAAALTGRELPSGGPTQPIVRPGRGGASARGGPQRSSPLLDGQGDFNGDGVTNEQEAANFQALSRFVELTVGGRLDVFLDRIVARFDFTLPQQQLARKQLRAAKQTLTEAARQQDLALCDELQQALGTGGFRDFQLRIVDRLAEVRTASPQEPFPVEEAESLVWGHDRDENGLLSADEVIDLARTLSTAPGGFGQVPPPGVDMKLFATRLLQFDENGDEAISPNELPERMRYFAVDGDRNQDGRLEADELRTHLQTVAFDRIVLTGIYVGGGFVNTLVSSQAAVDEISLPDNARRRAKELLTTRESLLKRQNAESLREQFDFLSQLAKDAAEIPSQPERK